MSLPRMYRRVHWDMNSQDLPTKDGPLTVNEQVPVSFLFQLKSQRFAPVAVHALASLRCERDATKVFHKSSLSSAPAFFFYRVTY